jgi:flagellar hook-basal body protein
MFSGVAGMKTHQTKLDVIGNNIANVNTYGYKAQRAIFSDIFYQTLNGASQGTANRGGTNPSTVGYGSTLASIQTQMSQSSMQNTGFGLDVAITGEGFLQVMDADGNVFYTKAGLLDYDANGYLVDINGNFVLGATDASGKPNTQKIKLDSGGAVSPASSAVTQGINGVMYTMTASSNTKEGNVLISLTSGQLPIGEKAKAVISSSGAITVQLNASEVFSSLTELNNEINKAITLANNNQQHVGGVFTLTMTNSAGDDLSSRFTATTPASLTGATAGSFSLLGGAEVTEVSADFAASGTVSFSGSFTPGAGGNLTLNAVVGGKTYTVTIPYADIDGTGDYTAVLSGAAGEGSLKMSIPKLDDMAANLGVAKAALEADLANAALFPNYVDASTHSYATTAAVTSVGLTGEQITLDNYDVTPGTITGFPVANFKLESTSNDFTGSGAISAFGLTYDDAGGVKSWTVAMNIDGKIYSGTIPETAVGSSLLLKGPAGDSIQLGIPSFSYINTLYSNANGGVQPAAGDDLDLMDSAQVDPPFATGNTAQPALASRNLGLASTGFTLTGGTEGGPITLDQLTSIAIGTDGSVSVSHPEKGTTTVGKVSLANFANPRGLLQEGTNYYSETVNSGKAVLCDPGTGGTGGLKANSLEMSNVDLSQEFADMITTQRGFQANTRVITVSDTMLEELINLKR